LDSDFVRLNGRAGGVLCAAITAAYAATYVGLGILRFRSYHASCDDGLFLQAISTAFAGFHDTPEGASHFAYHFSPILYALAPPVWLWRSPIVLIVAQAVGGALTIPAIYAIARRRLPAAAAVLVAVVAALYPALGGLSFTDFSENAFAPAGVAWLLWAIDARRMPLAASFALLCLSIKEDQALFLAFLGTLGAVYFARRGEPRWMAFSIATTIGSLATFVLFMTVVRHATGVWYGYPSIRDFYGGMPPLQLLSGLFAPPKIAYVFAALLPLLGICLLSRTIVLAIPGLLECLLSHVPVAYMIGQHYAATWVPYVLVAFALGVWRIWRFSPVAAYVALSAAIGIGAYVNVFASPNDWSASLSPRTHEMASLDAFVDALPRQASVTSFCQVYAHLGMHPNATVYAQVPTTYIVIFPARDDAAWDVRERAYALVHGYRVIQRDGALEIYRSAS
jgi:uncharacterized membrane protein